MVRWFDAHCHLSDLRLSPLPESWQCALREACILGGVTCASFPETWSLPLPQDLPFRRAYGIHPWCAAHVDDASFDALDAIFRNDPHAIIGEIGLDGIRPTPDDGEVQRRVLRHQLALAVTYSRPVVLHGARKWGALFDELEQWVAKLPAVMIHGAAFAPQLLQRPLFRHQNVWFSFGSDVLRQKRCTAVALAAAVPWDRVLIETDAPDRLPSDGAVWISERTGERLNHPANLLRIGEALARLRGVSISELAEQTFLNGLNFCSAQR
ncbi:MAG: TatD family hydrolase [Kiritimatiellae bacterium]|nr:TatD family hydrolase [Kiritimatiellia bacterium]